MGFDEGQIELDSPNGAYYSGQAVCGTLNFTQSKVKTFRGIYVQLKGYCKVHWTTRHTRTVNGKSESYTVSHDSHEEYVNVKTYLVGGESGEHSINPGTYEYNFRFNIPPNGPSSFEGTHGHVRYEIKAVVDRAFKFDQEKKVAVRVMAPLDLNLQPSCRNPVEFEFHDSYCCFCMGSGSADTSVKLPVSGYCPGQTIPIEVKCSNRGGVEIDYIKLEITKKLTFTATHNPGTKTEKVTIAEIKKNSIPTNTSRDWTLEMIVPALDVYNLINCRYIDVEYKFKVTVNPDGCHSSTDGSQHIIIGTIPLVGFQDNVRNPLEDQLPQQTVTAVTQQPVSVTGPYPGSPYPPVVDAQPYPPTASPYLPTALPHPTAMSPYPNSTSPYPNTASPYPNTGSPYPNTASPYPNPASPYPNPASPYPNPATASPYPSKSPYPTDNSPYPAAKPIGSPYPDNPPPYPNTNQGSYPASPYAANSTPYPGAAYPPNPPYPESSPHPSKTDKHNIQNIGFTVPEQNDTNTPLLPHFAPAPYPPSSSPNPFATATAPTLDSPEGQK